MAVIRIVLVDDHRVVTTSLKAYLESFADLRVVGVATTGEQLLARLGEWAPDVILQDLLLPGGIDGIETTRRVLAAGSNARVVALTASMDEARMMGVLRAGAVGYVRKDAEPETLLAAVRAVAAGRTYIDPTVSRHLVAGQRPGGRRDGGGGRGAVTLAHPLKPGRPSAERPSADSPHAGTDDLTPRELDVLRQLARGHSNREIAAALDISDETVKTHVGHVLAKLQVENRAQAIVHALRQGLVALDEVERDT